MWCMILYPDTCMYDAFIYVPRSLTMMHVCMMHISMILDLHPEACMYVWCMYLWCGKFCSGRTDGRTDERTDKAILGVGFGLGHLQRCHNERRLILWRKVEVGMCIDETDAVQHLAPSKYTKHNLPRPLPRLYILAQPNKSELNTSCTITCIKIWNICFAAFPSLLLARTVSPVY